MPHTEEVPNTSYRSLHDLPSNERPRERLHLYGESALSTIELLAVVIGSGFGEENVLRLAERLLVHFDDLPGLATASMSELTSMKGIGEAKASRLKACQELGRRIYSFAPNERIRIDSPENAANLLMTEMVLLKQEHVKTILLDTRNQVIKTPTVFIGNLNSTSIRLGDLFRLAIRENAAAVIVVHNHPSGDPSPSPEDICITKQIVQSGELLGVDVLDHIIIGHCGYVSLKDRGLGFD